jgi:SAM-dependent methyltransferase
MRSVLKRVRGTGLSASSTRQPKDAAHPATVSLLPHCLVCQSTKMRDVVMKNRKTGRKMTAVCCDDCRYVSLPDNRRDYHAAVSTKNLGGSGAPRMGTWEEPGREYGMAKLGLQVLGRKNASVLMYGAGQSIDNHHIAKLRRAGRVAIGDLVPLRGDAECVNTTELSTDPFDVVLASEVLEHFPDPHPNFENLFSYVKDDGIIIASTNIRDSLPMRKVGYVWPAGHVSYWSPQALRLIARKFGMHLDFRVPLCATGGPGPRKRYVIFSRSLDVMDSVADWFGSHTYAPSERPDAARHEAAVLPGPLAI